MTTTPAQPAQGPYRTTDGHWIHAADGKILCHVSATVRYMDLDQGRAWDKTAEPYPDYRERIKPEMAREDETRKATARLLAASWEMREALQNALALADSAKASRSNPNTTFIDTRDWEAFLAAVRTALQKADAVG